MCIQMMKSIMLIFICIGASCANSHVQKESSWADLARRNMVERQIRARGIADTNVINAMLKVKRHTFVPANVARFAYEDYPLPIGEGQTISQPYIVALMTEQLDLQGDERVLEIGTGSGYQAAILSLIAKEVYTIEIVPSLAQTAAERLKLSGYTNVFVKCGDGFLGWPDAAPFDAIIVTCAPPEVPRPLIDQLAEGGRLIAPLGENFQMLTLFKKIDGQLQKTEITPVLFVPMKGLIEEK